MRVRGRRARLQKGTCGEGLSESPEVREGLSLPGGCESSRKMGFPEAQLSALEGRFPCVDCGGWSEPRT